MNDFRPRSVAPRCDLGRREKKREASSATSRVQKGAA